MLCKLGQAQCISSYASVVNCAVSVLTEGKIITESCQNWLDKNLSILDNLNILILRVTVILLWWYIRLDAATSAAFFFAAHDISYGECVERIPIPENP
jgi:hypothetical protein